MKKSILIFGGDGLIGCGLVEHYSRLGYEVFSTSRRPSSANFFDLADPNLTELKIEPKRYSHAIIAAGNTNLIQCEQDPSGTALSNVKGTLELARQLYLEGIKPVVFSSDYVFDGKKGEPYKEEDELSPLNQYGRQKAELEERLPILCPKFFLTIRLAKIYSFSAEKRCWIAKMIALLNEGKEFFAATDQIFSPIFLDDVIEAIDRLCSLNGVGLYNLGGPEVLSRYALALLMAKYFSISPHLINPILLRELNEPLVRPTMTVLSCDKFEGFARMKCRSLVATLTEKEELLSNLL